LSIGDSVSDSCRVHLINPPSAPGTVANREGAGGMGTVYQGPKGFLYPPHTLAVVAGSLRDAGCPVRASDLVVEESLPNLARYWLVHQWMQCWLARLRPSLSPR